MIPNLLPEEDVLDDPDANEADPTLPGDLWFQHRLPPLPETRRRGRAAERVVYSRAFVPIPA